ncbi:MAG: hypothetical protein P8R54_18885 [Myxococcota bacterium]|nr:hypothetical protein [Myxococcota bacterium]
MKAALEQLLQQVRDAIQEGSPVDHDAIMAISRKITSTPETIPRHEAAEVIRIVDALVSELKVAQQAVGQAMQDTRRGRAALQGYNHLRPASAAQKVRRKV